MFAGLALALGGGHLTIAAVAALPFLARLSHLAVPELVRRRGSGQVATIATRVERGGFLIAAVSAIAHPGGWTIPGFLAGLGIGYLGQAVYDASLAALHTEVTTPATFGRYTALKSRWAATAGLVLGVLASVAVDTSESLGIPHRTAPALAIITGVAVHLLVMLPLGRMRSIALRRARTLPRGVTPPAGGLRITLPSTPEQWAIIRFALAWGFAYGISTRQGEAMAISLLGVSVGAITLLNALLVGAGIVGAKTWGRLADRFGGKGLMSIALFAFALDPLWIIAAMLVHPAFLIPSYALWGTFSSGWNIAQNVLLVRTTGHAASRIRALVTYNVAFGLAAGVAPMLGGAILELLDGRYPATLAYGVLFATAMVLRLSAYRLLREMPAASSQRGRYVSTVVLRAVRFRARRRTRAIGNLGASVGSALAASLETALDATLDTTRGLRDGARKVVNG
jgi:hypothetical protein